MSKEDEIVGYPRRLAPHLELRRVLGEGGSSIVFEAFHTRLKVPVAVKLLSVRGSIAEQARVRLLREAELYALLDDPRIPRVYDVDELPDGTPYVVMEFVPGRSLEALLAHGALSPRRAVMIAVEVLSALAYVHARGVLHRDVKPANVILYESDDKCQVRLVDFGIAKVFADEPETGGPLTQQGTLVGTPHYMAPERLLGAESDEKSDVYSVGVMLYEMLSGSAPFVGPTLGEVIAAVLRDTPQPLHLLSPQVTPALAEIVYCAMRREPEGRYPSAEAMLQALGRLGSTLQGESSSPRIVPAVRSVAPPSLRTPAGLTVEDDDLVRRIKRKARLELPLTGALGIVLLIWAAWPSQVNEPDQGVNSIVAGDALAPGASAARVVGSSGAPSRAEGEAARSGAGLVANAPLAAEPTAQGLGETTELVPDEAYNGNLLLDVPAADVPADPSGVLPPEPQPQAASPHPAPERQPKRASEEEVERTPSYAPVQSVPLQPLLDRLDHMLNESLTVPNSPAVMPSIETREGAFDPTQPRAPARRARTAQGVPDNPY